MFYARCIDQGCGITTIDAEYGRPGLAASHLIVRGGRAAFVDTGSPASVSLLLDALSRCGLGRHQVDYVMVTHVHLDHAGGAGALLQALPNAKLVVHPLGVRHMLDPTRLVESTRAVYGELYERLYGEVIAAESHRTIETEDSMSLALGNSRIDIVHTPGHAHHHYCVHDVATQAIFTGDTFGISLREFDTGNGAFVFPSTTPTQFDPVLLHDSIDRLLSLDPEAAYLTHFGRVTDLRRHGQEMHADIDAFIRIALRYRAVVHSRKNAIAQEMMGYLIDRLRAQGYRLPLNRVRELLELDIDLNAQGLDVWLSRSGVIGGRWLSQIREDA